MTSIILPPQKVFGPGEWEFSSGDGPCEATLLITNSVSAPGPPGVGSSYISFAFGPGGPFQSTLSGGTCVEGEGATPCTAQLVMQLNISPADPADECQMGSPCPHYDFWHGAGSWNFGAPIPTSAPTWIHRPPMGGGYAWGVDPLPTLPFPLPPDPGSADGDSTPRARMELEVKCGGDNAKQAFIAIPGGGPPSGAAIITFELSCSSCEDRP